MGFSVRNAARTKLVTLINRVLLLLERLLQQLSEEDFLQATERDIYYSYRLFLHRRPDPEGYKNYLNQISGRKYPLESFTDSFLYSDELQEIQEKRNQPVLINLPDFQIFVRINDLYIGGVIAKYGVYEPNVTLIVKELIQPGMTFLDIGANIGYYSMLVAAKVTDKGRVLAFEPIAENRDLFAKSMEVNKFQNMELFPYAVSDSEHTVSLEMGGRTSNSRITSAAEANKNNLQAQTVVLDTFLSELTALDMIKMDIEGAEFLALNGMSSLVSRYKPHIITEFSPGLIPKTSHVQPIEYLQKIVGFGYNLQIIYPDGSRSETMLPQQILKYFAESVHSDHIDLLAMHPSKAV
ncbi:FkbM family methyltransferase [Candidatus Leptofilum sp.]|uniref:FkbM family methyltransferase n=1 Tax=Candidatus Leptofilum sp. TaxID=3241576 RepID=UPI003B5B2B18